MRTEAQSVSELTRAIKGELESIFPFVRVKGEISNCKPHSSGHLYLTLKDDEAQIPVVIWKSVRSRFPLDLKDGLEVVVEGRIEVYPPAGRYQLICTALSETGEGARQQAFARLLAKLTKAGYFSPAAKKPLPRIPRTIGMITSPTGAVIEDMGKVFARRFPAARLLLFPVLVQGEKAVESIVRAISYFNNPPVPEHRPDIVIIARGGGSSEDLQAFNEEAVANAIFCSKVPVISAIGHETDLTIADMVADLRAGTPSMAAELAVPDREELFRHIDSLSSRQTLLMHNRMKGALFQIDSICSSYAFNRPVIRLSRIGQQITQLEQAMDRAVADKLRQRELQSETTFQRLRMLDVKRVLQRGFVLVSAEGHYVVSSSSLPAGTEVSLEFYDGLRNARLTGQAGS